MAPGRGDMGWDQKGSSSKSWGLLVFIPFCFSGLFFKATWVDSVVQLEMSLFNPSFNTVGAVTMSCDRTLSIVLTLLLARLDGPLGKTHGVRLGVVGVAAGCWSC